MSNDERWLPVPGLDGYDVSNQGQIRSTRRGKPRMMRTGRGPCGYHVVSIQMNPRGVPARSQPVRLGSMVMAAFVGPIPDGLKVRHLNGNLLDDRLENLRYGTPAEVRADQVARARREEAAGAPTHCPKGHRYADLYEAAYGARLCRECERGRRAALVGVRTSICIDCGTVLQSQVTPGRRKRCDPCAVEAHRRTQQKSYRKRSTTVQPRTGSCVDCGADLRPSVQRLRCDEHAAEALRAAQRRYKARQVRGRVAS